MEQAILQRHATFKSKLQDLSQLIKFRLSFLVVFSAAMAFLSAPGVIEWPRLIMLIIGGFFVTGASNGFNQIIEKDLDKIMSRTALRPLPDQRMTVQEALLVSLVFAFSGVIILYFALNPSSAALGLFAMIAYAFFYTPLKRKTPFSVFVGAIPGAIPPLLGWVAATGSFGLQGWLLFTIQFLWQFPHFWAIAWVLDDDYKKAGFIMLPSHNRDKGSSLQIFIYALSLLPAGFMPFIFRMNGIFSLCMISAVTLYFIYYAYRLHQVNTIEMARKVMFASFIYLPVVQLIIMLDKT
jgi:protoheme IX farnesyltransferase